MNQPGDGEMPRLELTYNFGVESYELGTGYGHIAITSADLDDMLARLADQGIEPEKPPYSVREGGSRLCFVRDPDGYRIEIIGDVEQLTGPTLYSWRCRETNWRSPSGRLMPTTACIRRRWRRTPRVDVEPLFAEFATPDFEWWGFAARATRAGPTKDARASKGLSQRRAQPGRRSGRSPRSSAIWVTGSLCWVGCRHVVPTAGLRWMRPWQASWTFAGTGSAESGPTSITPRGSGLRDRPRRCTHTYCRSTSALKLSRASSRLLAFMRLTRSASAIFPNTPPGSA